jgi:hypothetical protein
MTCVEFVKVVAAEFGLTLTDDEADGVLWNKTGFPSFFHGEGTYEQLLRPQLEEAFSALAAGGGGLALPGVP